MIDFINENIEDIKRLCVEYKVKRLEVFGSAASGEFNKNKSDVDFLVEFKPLKLGEYANMYFGLLEELEALLNCSVDLVMISAVKNPFFLEAINNTRRLLYAA